MGEWFSKGERVGCGEGSRPTVSRAINEDVLKASTIEGHNSLKLLL